MLIGSTTGAARRARTSHLLRALSATTALALVSAPAFAQAPAATASRAALQIPAQPLSQALVAFSSATGVQLFFSADLLRGIRSPGVQGTMSNEQALKRLLAGSGLDYRFTNATTVTIQRPSDSNAAVVTVPGAVQLDTIEVSGSRVRPADVPYQTAAPVAHISSETIERFRGSSPADIFRGTPGVLSGEARNGGGGIDVNIRGMQGMGRVAVTIDGAENNMTVYQGYQGISNRTFIDPDLLAGIDITKGSDASSRGIAGTVAMRTVSADDIVKPGEKWGVWVKSGFGTNTATPRPGDRGGYTWPRPYVSDPQPYPVPTAQASGVDRPNMFTPTSGSFSTIAAVKEDNYDLLWGYAYRRQGNYFAGRNGPGASVIDTGPQPLCYSSGFCYYPPSPISYAHVYQNGGISSYRAGEQVLNTQLETESYLAKATVRDDNGQSLQVGYNGFRSRAGDQVASLFSSVQSQAVQQAQENLTQLDTGTVRYRWKPEENGLIDLKANYWMTTLNLRTPPRVSLGSVPPESLGLPFTYMPGNDTTMWGTDLSNRSHLDLGRSGTLDLDYGLSYLDEATKPMPYSDALNLGIPARNGTRQEAAGYTKAAYKPVDWLTLNGGLRYSHYWSQDRSTTTSVYSANPNPSREQGGYSPSAGIVVEPIKGWQIYGNYSSALRMPSLFESVAAYTLNVISDLKPERSNNWEVGTNLSKSDLFAANDRLGMKFGYFNWHVKDYVARQSATVGTTMWGTPVTGLRVLNIDSAHFEGLEFSSRYEVNGFTAELAANYYTFVQYCITANQCTASTLSGDYSTNHVPPAYSANLTLSQKLLDDDLTVGGRILYNGPRSIGHGEIQYGAAALIAPIYWQPYWLMDVFAEYKLSKDITLWASVENVADTYYVDPLSLVQQPGPGRTARLGLTGKFGGSNPRADLSLARLFTPSGRVADWSGVHLGASGALAYANISGTASPLNGSTTSHASNETPEQHMKALSYGVQLGYDRQFSNRVILGIEADIARTTLGKSQVTYSREATLLSIRGIEASQQTDITWLSTVRGRLGYAVGEGLMVYATGGVALMEQSDKRMQFRATKTGTALFDAINGSAPDFLESASTMRVGYAIGGGAAYRLDDHWSVSAEYLLASFGEKNIDFPGAKAGVMVTNGFGYPVTSTVNEGRRIASKVDLPMIKLGVNYRF